MKRVHFSILILSITWLFLACNPNSTNKDSKGLTEGVAKGWVIADMKKDFKQVFSFEK